MLRNQNITDHSLRHFIVSFNEKNCKPIHVSFDPLENYLHEHPKKEYNWALLSEHQCTCCPLKKQEHPYCPAALSIASLLNPFSNYKSIESVTVEVEDLVGRKTLWKTTLQSALFSLVRTAMFFSGCPVTEEFRSFIMDLRSLATEFEIQKALVIRFLLMCKGDKEEAKKELNKRIEDFHCINIFLTKRIMTKMKGDAVVNSLIIADSVGMLMNLSFDEIYQEICKDIESVKKSSSMNFKNTTKQK